MSDSDDDDPPQLSAHALAALQEFYAEQSAKSNEEHQAMEAGGASKTGIIQEDWVSVAVLPQVLWTTESRFDSRFRRCMSIWFPVQTCFCRFFSRYSGFPPASKTGLLK